MNSGEEVDKILKSAKIEVVEGGIEDVVDVYDAYLEYAKNNNIDTNSAEFQADLTEKVQNYARSLRYVSNELDAAEAMLAEEGDVVEVADFQIEGITAEDIKNNNADAIKAAYTQFGNERVAFYDTDYDKKISFEEYKQVAVGDEEIDAETEAALKANFAILAGEDNMIEASESAAYHWAMSKALDGVNGTKTANDITNEERTAVMNNMHVKALMEKSKTQNLSEEEYAFLEEFTKSEENNKSYDYFFKGFEVGKKAFKE